MYKTDKERVVTFGFRTQFGGGRSTGFGLIYDDEASQKKFEPRFRLVRVSVIFLLFLFPLGAVIDDWNETTDLLFFFLIIRVCDI